MIDQLFLLSTSFSFRFVSFHTKGEGIGDGSFSISDIENEASTKNWSSNQSSLTRAHMQA